MSSPLATLDPLTASPHAGEWPYKIAATLAALLVLLTAAL